MMDFKALKAEIEELRRRDEARLLLVARENGFFFYRTTKVDMRKMFKDSLDARKPLKNSKHRLLEVKMNKAQIENYKQSRNDDARRKILMGAFLIAQFQHKPVLKRELVPELEKFLDQHRDADVAASNKELLKDLLRPAVQPAPDPEAQADPAPPAAEVNTKPAVTPVPAPVPKTDSPTKPAVQSAPATQPALPPSDDDEPLLSLDL